MRIEWRSSSASRAGAALVALLLVHGVAPANLLGQGGDGGKCSAIRLPGKLPPVDALVDSAALSTALEGAPQGELVFSLAPAASGVLVARALEPSVAPDELRDRVQDAIRPEARLDAPSVRLRVDLAGSRLALERSQLCNPTPLQSGQVARVTVTTSGPVPPKPRNPVLRLLIGADGAVVEARLTSGTGIPAFDDEILRTAPQVRYSPALLDGRPVAVWWERGRATPVP